MYCDFKCTIWERIKIPEELENEFKNALLNGELTTINEAYGLFGDKMDAGYELLLDTGENMTPEENGGFATVELHSDENAVNDDIIWANGLH